jgi:5-(carboxyamino)imidazole ribonucleotide mutase
MDKAKAIDVGVIMGSDSDWPLLKQTASTLDSFGVGYEVRVISAHRSPATATGYAGEAAARGLKVVIAAAGGAAHLAGVLAAHTTLPVIGVPVKGGALDGLDALLSTVQMPAGIPVGTVALGNAGAVNAAILAVQILALGNPALAQRLVLHKKSLADKVAAADEKIQAELKASKA